MWQLSLVVHLTDLGAACGFSKAHFWIYLGGSWKCGPGVYFWALTLLFKYCSPAVPQEGPSFALAHLFGVLSHCTDIIPNSHSCTEVGFILALIL